MIDFPLKVFLLEFLHIFFASCVVPKEMENFYFVFCSKFDVEQPNKKKLNYPQSNSVLLNVYILRKYKESFKFFLCGGFGGREEVIC